MVDEEYFEYGLPDWLRKSADTMAATWALLDAGGKSSTWDCDFCDLQTDINNAEVNGIISSEQAWYLREKYLRIKRG